ncbi:hypothetical protein PR048_008081 [Dryococelus australis]|uniref:Uncharacterized protein n=1 Tax=Dryococelus australis TaxID=614101 RepID=A0ABQ9HW29_9NEOP|nr:hypothetical protein PR048_008081 [Dryococelus australis]
MEPQLLDSKDSRGNLAHVGHSGCRGDVVVRLLATHLGEPGSIPGGVAPGFSHVRIVRDDSAGQHVSSGIFCSLPPLYSGAAAYSPRFIPVGSQDLDVKSKPNSFTHSLAERFKNAVIQARATLTFDSYYQALQLGVDVPRRHANTCAVRRAVYGMHILMPKYGTSWIARILEFGSEEEVYLHGQPIRRTWPRSWQIKAHGQGKKRSHPLLQRRLNMATQDGRTHSGPNNTIPRPASFATGRKTKRNKSAFSLVASRSLERSGGKGAIWNYYGVMKDVHRDMIYWGIFAGRKLKSCSPYLASAIREIEKNRILFSNLVTFPIMEKLLSKLPYKDCKIRESFLETAIMA